MIEYPVGRELFELIGQRVCCAREIGARVKLYPFGKWGSYLSLFVGHFFKLQAKDV
jgi:hypothetical protein